MKLGSDCQLVISFTLKYILAAPAQQSECLRVKTVCD